MKNASIDTSKRRLLAGTVAATAALATAGMAQGQPHQGHHHKTDDSLIGAANDCVQTAQACLSHCLLLVADGDTSIAACMRSVSETIPICDTFSKLLTLHSKYAKDYAKLCLSACNDCEKECRKHAKKHKECKDCADSCVVMVKKLKAFIG